MRRIAFLALFLAASIAQGEERVRVIVAVGLPEAGSVRRLERLRENVIGSLDGKRRLERWGKTPVFAAEVTPAELERLRRDPRVKAVDIDTGGGGAMRQSVGVIGADSVRAQGFDGTGITVAVLDTGIDRNNPDFAGRVAGEQCFCTNADGTGCCPNGQTQQSGVGAAQDEHGHGSHVAGIVAGGGANAPAGVAPAAKIVAVRVMSRFNRFDSITQVFRGLQWILEQRPDVRVINMSLGTSARFTVNDCNSAAAAFGMQPIVAALRNRGVLITASSGNNGALDGVTLPACMQDVLGIGATYDTAGTFDYGCFDVASGPDHVTCFTNSTDAIDLLAPGAPITSVALGGGERTFIGTSMAAPHVAGAIALLLQRNPTLKADQLEQILKLTGTPVVDVRNDKQFPRLDVAAAIAVTPAPVTEPGGKKRRGVRH